MGMSVGTGRDCIPVVSSMTSKQHSSSEMMRLAGFMMEVKLELGKQDLTEVYKKQDKTVGSENRASTVLILG